MLKDMSVDALKMDLKFLSETNNNARAGNIISSVIRMAHALDIDVIAEGVETEEQAKLLKNMGCVLCRDISLQNLWMQMHLRSL